MQMAVCDLVPLGFDIANCGLASGGLVLFFGLPAQLGAKNPARRLTQPCRDGCSFV
jgi:hypothetical protein